MGEWGMIRRLVIVVGFLLIAGNGAFGLTVYIAPVPCYADEQTDDGLADVHKRLMEKLDAQYEWEQVSFKALDSTIEVPKSFMDAIRICRENALEYLIYGFIEVKDYSVNAELKLFDSGKQEVIRVFYSSDNRDQIARLLDDLAVKIAQYFAMLLGAPVTAKQVLLPTEGLLALAIGGGYWMPLAVQWADKIQALYSACLALRFIPWRPAAGGFYFKTGLTGNFYHSLNKAGYEGMQLFTVTAGIPFYLCLDIGRRQTVSLGVEPQLAFDYLVIEKLNDNSFNTYSLLFASDVSIEYEFHITRFMTLHVGNKVLFQFLNTPRIAYNPQLMFAVNLNPGIKGNK